MACLKAWEYRPRRFYLEYMLGEMADNEHILVGRHLHRCIEEGMIQKSDTWIHRHQWVWSDRLLVSGSIDAVEEREEHLIPLEYKKGQMGRHLSDHFQLVPPVSVWRHTLARRSLTKRFSITPIAIAQESLLLLSYDI